MCQLGTETCGRQLHRLMGEPSPAEPGVVEASGREEKDEILVLAMGGVL